jgi:hypothetical protein
MSDRCLSRHAWAQAHKAARPVGAFIACAPLHHPKAATLVVNKLPKFVRYPRLTLRFRELRCYRGGEITSVRRLSRNDPIDIQRRVCPRRQKPPTDVCRNRVCICWRQAFVVAQDLRDYLFCFGRIDSNIGHFQPFLRARAKLLGWVYAL